MDGAPATDARAPVIVVENFPALGRLVAFRFIEWVLENPEGVVSLPTGKTPQHFIDWVVRLLGSWDEPETRALLEEGGIDPSSRPSGVRMDGLRFVQIDEFYPIPPTQHNSFFYYVNSFYLRPSEDGGFGLDPARALLIDCSKIGLSQGQSLRSVWPDMKVDLSLRLREARTQLEETQKCALERIDQWCSDYEARVRELGGIGFFLGGIGPDGHVAFNVRGADHFSTTRLTASNYPTQAAAASDLGGIKTARSRHVITIGLGTITWNPACTAVIMASGAAKAGIVAASIESSPDVRYPATALQKLARARFYLTAGAASELASRRRALVVAHEHVDDETRERILIDLAVRTGKRLVDLADADLDGDPLAGELARRRPEGLKRLAEMTRDALVGRIERGAARLEDTRFLHTEPHHDDLMIGCLPAIVRNSRHASNRHHFATMTSGFTAVTNDYMRRRLSGAASFLASREFEELDAAGYFDPSDLHARNRDVWQYLDGVAACDDDTRDEGAARRLLRDLAELTGNGDPADLREEIDSLVEYVGEAYPGKKD
ncbi:MAG: 6-phosphogluconolactonase, partial [Planctomycetota bacterium]